MLTLERDIGESICIGDDVVVTVVRVRGNKVRLGIAAPLEVEVDRSETRDRIAREGRRVKAPKPPESRP